MGTKQIRSIKKDSKPQFAPVTFSEEHGVRFLHFGTWWVQGAMRIDQPDVIELEYAQQMMAGLLFLDPNDKRLQHDKNKPFHMVQLGLGTGALTKFAHKQFPKARVTAVDLNPAVIVAARVMFNLPPPNKNLNLLDAVHTSNMVMFDPENKIKKYETVKDILEEFCNVRYSLYEVRKEGIIKDMENELKYLKNKINFITEMVNNTISLKERDDESLNRELTTKNYDMKEASFDYLLNIQVKSMTSKRIKELKDKEIDLKHQLNRYKIKTIKDIWTEELNELVADYKKWLSFENDRKISSKDKKAKKVVKK